MCALCRFTFFRLAGPTGTVLDAPRDLFKGGIDRCLTSICTLRSWPDRPPVYDGTPYVGDGGAEMALGAKGFGFFVARPQGSHSACTLH